MQAELEKPCCSWEQVPARPSSAQQFFLYAAAKSIYILSKILLNFAKKPNKSPKGYKFNCRIVIPLPVPQYYEDLWLVLVEPVPLGAC